jgi:hypothetical protein
VFAPVVGEAHGELADAAAAGAVWAEAGESGDAGDGADVDDAAVVVLDHATRNSLRNEETASQICVENQIPVVPRDVDGGLAHVAAGVVDEDVDLAEGGSGVGDKFLNAGVIADVEREGCCAAAEGFHFAFERGKRIDVAAGEDEIGASFCESAREMLAEAAAGAGDDGNLASEIEKIFTGSGIGHFFVAHLCAFSRSENHFQQARFAGVKAVKPYGAVFQWNDLRNQRFYVDGARREKFDRLRIFTGGSAGALQTNLTAHYLLQMDFDFGGEITHERDGAAFADGVDAVGDGFGASDGFENGVYANVVGELEDLRGEIRFRVEDFGGAEIFRHFEARIVDVGNEDAIGAGGAERLEDEKTDHACADDKRRIAVVDRSDSNGVESDGRCLEHCGFREWKIVRQAMDDARGDDDVFCESTGAAIVAAGDTEDLAIVTEIDVTAFAVGAGAAEDGGVEGDAFAGFEIFYVRAEGGDKASGFVAHDEGWDATACAAVEAVDVAAADAAGGDLDEDFVGRWTGFGSVGNFEVVVLG